LALVCARGSFRTPPFFFLFFFFEPSRGSFFFVSLSSQADHSTPLALPPELLWCSSSGRRSRVLFRVCPDHRSFVNNLDPSSLSSFWSLNFDGFPPWHLRDGPSQKCLSSKLDFSQWVSFSSGYFPRDLFFTHFFFHCFPFRRGYAKRRSCKPPVSL